MDFDPAHDAWPLVSDSADVGRSQSLAFCGLDENGNGPGGNTIEMKTGPAGAVWQKTRDFTLPLYPHLFQLANGRLFHTGGKMDSEGDSVPLVFDQGC